MTLPLTGAGPSSGSFDPLSLSPALWFKADALSLNDADKVATWTDSSGNGRNATQATEARKPTYKTNILNGKPVLRWDGTAFINLGVAAFTLGDVWSLFVVANATALDSGASDIVTSASRLRTLTAAGPVFQATAGGGSTTRVTTLSAWHLLSGVRGATSLQVWVDQGSGGAAAIATATTVSEAVTIGMNPAFSSTYSGDMAEILFFTSSLSAGNQALVEGYLKTKYAI